MHLKRVHPFGSVAPARVPDFRVAPPAEDPDEVLLDLLFDDLEPSVGGCALEGPVPSMLVVELETFMGSASLTRVSKESE